MKTRVFLKYFVRACSPKIRYFCPKFKDFYFWTKLCNEANSRVLISNMKMIFQSCDPKYLIKTFLKFKIFYFYTKLAKFDKLEGVDFKYDNFCTKYAYFLFLHETSHNKKIEGNNFFQIPSKKYPNKKFSLKTQSFFLFK